MPSKEERQAAHQESIRVAKAAKEAKKAAKSTTAPAAASNKKPKKKTIKNKPDEELSPEDLALKNERRARYEEQERLHAIVRQQKEAKKAENLIKSEELRVIANAKKAERAALAQEARAQQDARRAQAHAREVVYEVDWSAITDFIRAQVGKHGEIEKNDLNRIPSKLTVRYTTEEAATAALKAKGFKVKEDVSCAAQARPVHGRCVNFYPMTGQGQVDKAAVEKSCSKFGAIESMVSRGGIFVVTFKSTSSMKKAIAASLAAQAAGKELRLPDLDFNFHYMEQGIPVTTRQHLEKTTKRPNHGGGSKPKKTKSA